MNLDITSLEPIEVWFKKHQVDTNAFPHGSNCYFDKYWRIKQYLAEHVYSFISAGTSSEDGGIYTDHSIDHFNYVIRYAGKLLGLNDSYNGTQDIDVGLSPYEVFIMLVSILLHDAGNIEGRKGHEKHPQKILQDDLATEIPDRFEAKPIADIAQAHGGKIIDSSGIESKDTFSPLKSEDTYAGKSYRPKLIASIVRFSDEICEDRSRASRYHINKNILPVKSEVYHQYASAITSVDVDLKSKWISMKFELVKSNVMRKFGKDVGAENPARCFLVDEINERLEKMYCELLYCKSHMIEVVHINQIRANVSIYDVDEYDCLGEVLYSKTFELKEEGYPTSNFSFRRMHPDWSGLAIKKMVSQVAKDKK